MSEKLDPYRIHGVTDDAPDYVIEAAYRACLKKYHPDIYSGSDAKERTAKIIDAYQTIKAERSRSPQEQAEGTRNQHRSQDSAKASQTKNSEPPTEKVANGTTPRPSVGALMIMAVVGVAIAGLAINQQRRSQPMIEASDAATDLAADPTSGSPNSTNNYGVIMPAEEPVQTLGSAGPKTAPLVPAGINAPTISDIMGSSKTNGPDEQLDFAQIEAGFNKFVQVFKRNGMMGARRYSESCHKAASTSESWTKDDYCASFDFAAALLDLQMEKMGAARNPYFQFQLENQSQYYEPHYLQSNSRISKIRDAISTTLTQIDVSELIDPK